MNISLLSRYAFFAGCVLATLLSLAFVQHPWAWPALIVFALLSAVGVRDLMQQEHAVKRNYPILGNIRYCSKASARRSASTCWKAIRTASPSPVRSAR